MNNQILCTVLNEHEVLCNGTLYNVEEQRLTPHDNMFWVFLAVYVVLTLIAGMMSGLTIGLMSLDVTQLEILLEAGKPKERKYAKVILPLVKRTHLLLVTLLLANAVCVESMPIFMDKISNPIIAILVSVTAVLIFGEIIPQALCTKYGLAIGYYLSPLVKLIMLIFLVISWPISKLLDCLLGPHHTMYFRRAELKVLVNMHQKEEIDNEEPLSIDEALIIKGALDLSEKTAKDASVPLESVYMLDKEAVLDFKTMTEIIERGHSRIPVYSGERLNIIGLILVKSIITLDPDDSVPVTKVMRPGRMIPTFPEHEPLYNILNACQTGKSHICMVTSIDGETITGIITLEDIIEEILQEDIIDETDKYSDVKNRIKVATVLHRLSAAKSCSRQNSSSTLQQSPLVASSSSHGVLQNDEFSEKSPLLSP